MARAAVVKPGSRSSARSSASSAGTPKVIE
jgi:hypothetical protein